MNSKKENPDNGFSPEQERARVEAFVRENIIEAVSGTRCGDGRYENGSPGKISLLGADLGLVMALLATNKVSEMGLSVKDCWNLIKEAVREEGGFSMHTDDHEHGEGGIGCGHAAKAADAAHSAKYIEFLLGEGQPKREELIGLFGEEMRELISLANRESAGSDIENIVLTGSHQEAAVLIVKGLNNTLEHQDREGNQFFVYDETRANERIEKVLKTVSEALKEKGVEFGEEQEAIFRRAFQGQTLATLGILAKGKGIFEVEISSNKEFRVDFVELIQ